MVFSSFESFRCFSLLSILLILSMHFYHFFDCYQCWHFISIYWNLIKFVFSFLSVFIFFLFFSVSVCTFFQFCSLFRSVISFKAPILVPYLLYQFSYYGYRQRANNLSQFAPFDPQTIPYFIGKSQAFSSRKQLCSLVVF